MKHAVSVLAVLVACTAGCSSEPSGPIEIARLYRIVSADGETVPVRAFRTLSNHAGTCVYDLMGGALTFNPTANGYGLNLSYLVRCAGTPGESWSHDIHNGEYTRAGDELSFTPRTYGTFTVERAQLQPGAATIDIRTNSGAEHRFHFVEASFD